MNASNKTTLCHKTNGLKNMYELKASLKRQQKTGFHSNTTHIRACNTACPSKNI